MVDPALNEPSRIDVTLIEAIHDGDLVDVALALPGDGQAVMARQVCGTIGERTEREAAVVASRLRTIGLDPSIDLGPSQGRQLHGFTVAVADVDRAALAIDDLRAVGFRPWQVRDGASWQVRRRTGTSVTLIRPDDLMLVVELQWPATPSSWQRVPRSLIPTAADFDAVTLPDRLWFLYLAIRPLRLVAERIGLRPRSGGQLGPFLSTPRSLIEPLLDLAEVSEHDTVVDLGCGDGRLVIEAVRRRGCRGIGIETDRDLVVEARANVPAELADRIEIRDGDAEQADLRAATVVFVFLPADVTARIVPEVLTRLAPGGRVVAHEQHRIDVEPPATIRRALFGDDAVTVAHRWDA